VTVPDSLLGELLPGPVTLCFKRKPKLNPGLNPTSTTIGIRIPDHAFIRAVAKGCGTAIALTSANRSGERSSVEISDFRAIWGDLGCVVDAGRASESRLGSTVVDLSQPPTFLVLREGDSAEATLACLRRHGLTQRYS
jgi:tRNA A37 threonylcarbamoyladenosine synthetase subunit TsaC/SUA5/YrdC